MRTKLSWCLASVLLSLESTVEAQGWKEKKSWLKKWARMGPQPTPVEIVTTSQLETTAMTVAADEGFVLQTSACNGVTCGAAESCVEDQYAAGGYRCECDAGYRLYNTTCKETILATETHESKVVFGAQQEGTIAGNGGQTAEEGYKEQFYPSSLIDQSQIEIFVAEGGYASAVDFRSDGFYAILHLVIEIVIDPSATLTTADLDTALSAESRSLNYEGSSEFDSVIDDNDLSYAIMECPFYQYKDTCGAYACRKSCESEAEGLTEYCSELSVASCEAGCLCDSTMVQFSRDFSSACVPVSECPHLNCPSGTQYNWTLTVDYDTGFCKDDDECLADPCDPYATCTNTYGSFECACLSGFTGDGFSCSDIDECADGLDDCDVNADCNDIMGGFECSCIAGWKGNGTFCENMDECTEAPPCDPIGGLCTDTVGSFTCACDAGFSGDGLNCTNIDECLLSPCHADAVCDDLVGSFTCSCNPGYAGDGFACQDVDECLDNLDNCDTNANCTNYPGTFSCACNSGYFGDGTNCTNIDECAMNTHLCDAQGTCVDLEGSHSCVCDSGYETGDDGFSCVDIDECAVGTDNCSADADCSNTVGSFTCACKTGFSGDGLTCSDIDECASSPCVGLATCTNNHGSFTCTCGTGFTGDGINTCENINECDSSPCDQYATCTDNIGSYTCVCNSGFLGNGFLCFDIDECAGDPCVALATCNNIPGSFECPCNSGYEGDGVTECTDIDECALDFCDTNASCNNTIGSVDCTCNVGYSGNGTYCENVNECDQVDVCQEYSTCTDTAGSFYCTCNAGYRLHTAQIGSEDGDTIDLCVEIVDCQDGFRGGCSHSCAAGECLCPACWELGLNGKDCSPSPQETEVICSAAGIDIKMSDCVVGDNTVELIEGTCKAVKSQDGTEHILATALNECGTSALHKGDCIMFSNQVIFTPPEVNGLIIHKKIAAQVDCFFNATASARSTYRVVNETEPEPFGIQLKSVYSLGQPQVTPNEFLTDVKIFKSDDYSEETELRMEVGEMIYGSVRAVNPIDGIYFMIESCAVVDEETGREYSFISDRCPNRALDGQLAIPDAEEVRFAFRAFSFTGGDGNHLSVSCQIQECSIEDPTNPCEISPVC